MKLRPEVSSLARWRAEYPWYSNAQFVALAERFGANVDVVKDGQSVSARSIMGLMMLGAGIGSSIELRAEGWDAKEALDALAILVEAGFNERD